MTKSQVMVAREYLAMLDGNEVRVRIEGVRKKGGWTAIDLGTGQTVVIKHVGLIQPLPEDAVVVVESPLPADKGKSPAGETPVAALEVSDDAIPIEAGASDVSPPAEGTESTPPAAPKGRKRKPEPESAIPKKLSALDAAAVVLATAAEPMTTKQLIEAMAARGLWTSPGGKTPAATLYSALLREITTKGEQARFTKADRGHFSARTGAR